MPFPPSNSYAASLGILLADVMNIYNKNPNNLTPPAIAGSALSGWSIDGYLVSKDIVFKADKTWAIDQNKDLLYGVLAHRGNNGATEYLAAIRGTDGLAEWLIDAEAKHKPYPAGGNVEDGFFGVYQQLIFVAPSGVTGRDPPAWNGIGEIISKAAPTSLTVAGHSLGAAIASYLAFDLSTQANLGNMLSVCLFACPRPGDQGYAGIFGEKVAEHLVYDYERDVVPNLPPTLMGYSSLPKVYELTTRNAQAIIQDEVRANHHALCYAAMLDYTAADAYGGWGALLTQNGDPENCIVGPNRSATGVLGKIRQWVRSL